MAKKLTKSKARKILHDKEVHGHPLTEQQRKFFGAIAGGAKPYKAQAGVKTCPPGFVNIEGKCFDRASDEYKALYKYGIGYMDDTDTLVSSRMELPEVVLKPKSVLDFLDKIDLSADAKFSDAADRYAFDQLGKKYGFIPNIKILKENQPSYLKQKLFEVFDPSRKKRELGKTPHYNSFSKTAYVDDIKGYIAELSHHVDPFIHEPGKFLMNDLPAFIKQKNEYETKGTREYTAHKEIQPKLEKDYIKYRGEYWDKVFRVPYYDETDPLRRKQRMDYIWNDYVSPVKKKKDGGCLDKYEKAQIGTMLTSLPSNWMDRLSDALAFPQKAVTKLFTGEYQTPSQAMGITNPIGAFATDAFLDPFNLFGGAGAARASGAYKNAYRLNPWAFKPNSEAYYRMLGKEGYADALESGFIRSNPKGAWKDVEAYFNKGNVLDDAYEKKYRGTYDVFHGYDGPHMVEVKNEKLFKPIDYENWKNKPKITQSIEPINISDPSLQFYKQDWLRGYKEVPKTKKKQDGGWLDKYDAPQAQNGIEGTMGGLTDVGFNYNGAWGGPSMQDGGNLIPPMAGANTSVSMAQLGDSVKPIPMQLAMGGSMPGAVGFMYARTQSPAPSNGPYAKKTKASAQNGEKVAKEWLKNWYEERKTLPEFENIASKRIEALEKVPAVQLEPAPEMRKRGMLAAYIPAKKSIIAADPSTMMEGYDPELGVSPYVLGHEMIHALDYMAPQSGRDVPSYPKVEFVSEKASGMSRPEYSWITSGAFPGTKTEVNAVLYGLRQAEGLKGNKPTTPNQMKSIIDKYKNLGEKELNPKTKEGTMNLQIKNLLDVMGNDPEKLSELNNRIVKGKGKAATTAQNGQEMKYYQAGLDFKPKTISQDGSDIPVDPEGYWNPENWGNPVIIPSTDITMEGVDQPLLGISDTGDVQYMEPGEDYEFDGEYVTEYPVAQRGTKVPAATTADSLRVYNNAMLLKNFYDKLTPYYESVTTLPFDDRGIHKKELETGKIQKETLQHRSVTEKNKAIIRANKDPNIQYISDLVTGAIDSAAPLAIYDRRISPKSLITYQPPNIVSHFPKEVARDDNKLIPLTLYLQGGATPAETEIAKNVIRAYRLNEKELIKKAKDIAEKQKHLPGYITTIPYYEPLAVKPYHMRTPEEKITWERKYGNKEKPTPPSEKKKVVTPTPEPVKETKTPAPEPVRQTATSPVVTAPSFTPPIVPSGSVGVFGPGRSRIGEYDEKTNTFYPDYGNLAARSKANQADADLISDEKELAAYVASKTGKKPKIDVTLAKQRNGGNLPTAQAGTATRADSLEVYNNAVAIRKYYDNLRKKGWYGEPRVENLTGLFLNKDWYKETMDQVKQESLATYRNILSKKNPDSYEFQIFKNVYPNASYNDYVKAVSKSLVETKSGTNDKYYYKDLFPSIIDPMAPSTLVNLKILPNQRITYREKGDEKKGMGATPPGGPFTGLYGYDPLSVKPYDMRTPQEKIEWERKYGNKEKPKATSTPPAKKKVVTSTPPPAKKKMVIPTPEPVNKPRPRVEAELPRTVINDVSYDLPTPKKLGPSKLATYPSNTPTKYSFSYPTGKYNEQETIYFPNKETWKSFMKGVKGATTQEGQDYAQATGYLKDGGNINDLDSQPLKKLDQLLNFTNYNKPTKGGWLDKYN